MYSGSAMSSILMLSLTGLAVSFYSIFVESRLKKNKNYKAACDLSDTISCTKPMLSQYTKLLGISNSIAAASYYLLLIILTIFGQQQLLMIVASAGLAVTFVFAYILYFKIKSICLICSLLYTLNILIALLCYFY